MATERTRVRRAPELGRYERQVIDAILDEALVAHIGIVDETGQPFVIPMAVARDGDRLLIHGSTASRLMRRAATGCEVCVTVTHLDGVVVSRSVFDSSMNYRSAVVLGRGRPITEREDKLAALRTLVEHLLPGRWEEARPPTDQELKATTILAVPLDEVSAKIRSGPPADDEKDLDLDVWAGEIPLRLTASDPVGDPLQEGRFEPSPSLERFYETRVAHVRELSSED